MRRCAHGPSCAITIVLGLAESGSVSSSRAPGSSVSNERVAPGTATVMLRAACALLFASTTRASLAAVRSISISSSGGCALTSSTTRSLASGRSPAATSTSIGWCSTEMPSGGTSSSSVVADAPAPSAPSPATLLSRYSVGASSASQTSGSSKSFRFVTVIRTLPGSPETNLGAETAISSGTGSGTSLGPRWFDHGTPSAARCFAMSASARLRTSTSACSFGSRSRVAPTSTGKASSSPVPRTYGIAPAGTFASAPSRDSGTGNRRTPGSMPFSLIARSSESRYSATVSFRRFSSLHRQHLLDEALPEGRLADERDVAERLQRAGDDLRGRGGLRVDEDRQRHVELDLGSAA